MKWLQQEWWRLQQNPPKVQELEKLEQQLESVQEYSDIAGNGDPNSESDNYGKKPLDGLWKYPNNNHLIIKPVAKVGNAYGAYMNAASVKAGGLKFKSMTNNKVIVSGGKFDCGDANGDIAGAFADDSIEDDAMNISSNTVRITGGSKIGNVYGGRAYKGTVSSSTVTISSSVTICRNVYGGYIFKNGTATENTVTISGGKIVGNVFGG